jgi:mxaA protein
MMAELPPPIHAVEIASPRDYGIVMGETLTGEIRVRTEAGLQLETASLPQPGSAVSDYLEVRKLDWERQSLGKETAYRITLTYQAFKGVREAETLTVPALPLRFNYQGQTVETEAPAWSFNLMPLIPGKLPDEAVNLRGDMPAPVYSTALHLQWLSVWLTGLVGMGVYAAWNLGLPPFRRHAPPFIRAALALKKLGRKPATPENHSQGVKLVHAALNETAGHTLFSAQLSLFLQTHPEYTPSATDLEQFFKASDRLFFSDACPAPADFPLSKLEDLCRKLASATGNKR